MLICFHEYLTFCWSATLQTWMPDELQFCPSAEMQRCESVTLNICESRQACPQQTSRHVYVDQWLSDESTPTLRTYSCVIADPISRWIDGGGEPKRILRTYDCFITGAQPLQHRTYTPSSVLTIALLPAKSDPLELRTWNRCSDDSRSKPKGSYVKRLCPWVPIERFYEESLLIASFEKLPTQDFPRTVRTWTCLMVSSYGVGSVSGHALLLPQLRTFHCFIKLKCHQ